MSCFPDTCNNVTYSIVTAALPATVGLSVISRSVTSPGVFSVLDILVSYVINLTIMVLGIVTNLLNLFIYSSSGQRDSVSISFMALSFSDLALLLLALSSRLTSILTLASVTTPVNFFQLSYLIVWYFQMMLDISTFTTTFIALQRCLCVAMPFQVKSLFTRTRTVIGLSGVYLFVITCYVPIFSKQFLIRQTKPFTNITMLVLFFVDGRDQVLAFSDILLRIVFRIMPEVIVVACLVVFIHHLHSSTNFQQKTSNSNDFVQQDLERKIQMKELPSDKHSEIQNSQKWLKTKVITQKEKTGTLRVRAKEKAVVLVVTISSAIFVVTNTPAIFLSLTRRSLPGFNLYQKYHDIFYLSYNLNNTLQFANAACSFFVYLKYNSRFRQTFQRSIRKFSMFPRQVALDSIG